MVFVNTELEYKEITEFISWFDDVVILRPEMFYREVIMYPLISKEIASKIRKLRHGNLSKRYLNYLLNGDERGSFGKLVDKWQFLLDALSEISEKYCDIMKKNPYSLL